MSTAATGYRHIELSESGVPFVAGTGYKVVSLIEQNKAHGWSAEELQHHYSELTGAQVHSVLAYYHDHAEEMEREIKRPARAVDHIRRQTLPVPVAARLRALRAQRAP
jgi:uncharacterized protein (DUF433 family)